jgi:membrane-associated phospholipid phosphatase
MLHHWKLVTVFGFILGFTLLYFIWRTYRNFARIRREAATHFSAKRRSWMHWRKISLGADCEKLGRRID